MRRRRRLTIATAFMALIGVGFVVAMFVSSMSFSVRSERRFLDVPLQSMELGSFETVEWLGKPVLIVRPSAEMFSDLKKSTFVTSKHRYLPSQLPVAFVFSAVSPQGCAVKHAEKGSSHFGDERWPGGFFDPCHYGAWDYAGRALELNAGSRPANDLPAPKFQINAQTVRLFSDGPE